MNGAPYTGTIESTYKHARKLRENHNAKPHFEH
jgi:hypothetical protein